MRYYAITGTAGGSFAFVTKPQLADAPTLSPSHHEIFDATLFKHRQDAENALDELPHGAAKRCNIVIVDVLPIATPA